MLPKQLLLDSNVYLARTSTSALPSAPDEAGASSDEDKCRTIASPYSNNTARSLVARLLEEADWDPDHAHTSNWNPFKALICPGDTVVLKPNWVNHQNHSGRGLDCLVTHASVLGAVLDLVLRAEPGKVIVGDAPIQGCDLPKLLELAGYNTLKGHYAHAGAKVEWRDFRRTVVTNPRGVWGRQTGLRPLEDYVLFDLGAESLLDPIAGNSERFRSLQYDPDLMRQAHAPGLHRYQIAREIIEADVVINIPKLKGHKKACVTGALKNLVGIIRPQLATEYVRVP